MAGPEFSIVARNQGFRQDDLTMIDIQVSRPAQYRRSLLLCVDEKYEPFAFALIQQIVAALPDLPADICVVSEHEIRLPPTLAHLPVRLCRITVDKGDTQFPQRHHISFAAYLRVFALNGLASVYDRILYLDSDMFFAGGDIAGLLDVQMRPGHAVAAVRDRDQQISLEKVPGDAVALGLPTFPFFNSGMMVVDTKAWIADGMLEKVLTAINDQGHAFVYHDQSALNLTLRGNWSELSWRWNFIYEERLLPQMDQLGPAFIHFAGRQKPWQLGKMFYRPAFIDAYETFLATHYPDVVVETKDQPRRLWQKSFLSLLRRKLIAAALVRAYRRRLAGPLDTIDPWP